MGFFVPNAGILQMITGVISQGLAIGSQALTAYGQAVSAYTAVMNTKEMLENALKAGFAGVLNQLSGLTGTRQVPTGLRNPLSSNVPEHELATDKANRADWPNGPDAVQDPLANLGNSVRMVEDMHHIATGLSSAEKATAVLGKSYSLLAQGLAKPALGLQLDGMLRLHSLNSVNVRGSESTNATTLKEHNLRQLKKEVEQGGTVQQGKVKGVLSGSVTGTCTGTVADAAVTGSVSGTGSGTLSGQLVAQVGKAQVTGGTVQPDGSVTGAAVTVQSLTGASISDASGSVSVKGTVTGSTSDANFTGSANGSVTGSVAGVLSGTVSAAGSQTPAVVKNATVSNVSGTGAVTGQGTVTGTGTISGIVSGQLAAGTVAGAEVSGGTIASATLTNPVYGPDGALEGGTVAGLIEGAVTSGGTTTGQVTGTASGSFSGTGTAAVQGKAKIEATGGTVNGGTCLPNAPDSVSGLKAKLAALRGKGTGSMPGNILDLGYGDAATTLGRGYLQSLPGKVADNLGSANGRLLDEYMTSPAPDLDSLTPLLPSLLLPADDTLQQLIEAVRTLQELIIYVEGLPEDTMRLLQQKVTQVGSDFVSFLQVIRNRAPEFGDRTRFATNYLRRGFTYDQRQLVRFLGSLWDNLQTDPAKVEDPALQAVTAQVMSYRKKVFSR